MLIPPPSVGLLVYALGRGLGSSTIDAEGVGGWSCAGEARRSSRIYSRQRHAPGHLIFLSLSPAALRGPGLGVTTV